MQSKSTLAALFAALVFLPFFAKTQTAQTEFGKNRVQFRRFAEDWVLYETANVGVYWYGDARNVAQSAVQMAEMDFAEIQQLLEHPMAEKIEILVFADLAALKQSNIGGEDESGAKDPFGRPLHELAYLGGQVASAQNKVRVVGTRAFVHFDGDHQKLRAQVREGMAGAMLNAMLFGDNLQEIVQNAVLLNLPPWFTDGLLAYAGMGWNPEIDGQLRDILATEKPKTFDKLAARYPRLAGQAMWHYVALTFGKSTVSNLLYLTRINRSVESGYLYVLGHSYRKNADAMMAFYRKRFAEDAKRLSKPEPLGLQKIKNRRNLPIFQLKISPDGQRLAFVKSDLGKWRVQLFDLKKDKLSTLEKGSSRNAHQPTDFSFPLLAWSPSGQELAVSFEKRGRIFLHQHDLTTKKTEKQEMPAEFQHLFSMEYAAPNELLFSAMLKGQSDLALFKPITRQTTRLTNDFWDDLDAAIFQKAEGERGVIWASNRPSDTLRAERLDTILPIAHFDIFYLDLARREAGELIQMTSTTLADERRPIQIDSAHFAFLSDETGVFQRKAGFFEPFYAFHRGHLRLKNGEKWTLECRFDDSKKEVLEVFRAWKTFDDAVEDVEKTVAVKMDSTFRLPKKAEIDSAVFEAVWKTRAVAQQQTNFDQSILELSAAPRKSLFAESVRREGRYQIFVRRAEPDAAVVPRLTRHRRQEAEFLSGRLRAFDSYFLDEKSVPNSVSEDAPAEVDSSAPESSSGQVFQPKRKVDVPDGWLFQSPFPSEKRQPKKSLDPAPNSTQLPDYQPITPSEKDSLRPGIRHPKAELLASGPDTSRPLIVRFNQSRIVSYRLKFKAEKFTTTMDNAPLFEGLQSFAGTPGDFRTPPSGLLVKGKFKDLFEDFELEGGFRVPATFNGAEYFLTFDNRKRRLDRRVALYRKVTEAALDAQKPGHSHGALPEPHRVRQKTVLGQYEVRWPLGVFTRLQATATLRQDRSTELSTDRLSAVESPLVEQRAGLRMAAVFDNSIEVDMNLRTGSRAKIWAEAVKKVQIDPENSLFDLKKGFMTVIGLDARHYQRLDRRSILAMRLGAGTTFGSERILYFLGGVDQGLFQKFNERIPLPTGDDFAFQTQAANLRGFRMNIRNGNSYALFNSEIRVPVFKYFSQKPTLGTFWRNFQVIGFFDAGTAWQGRNPYDGSNPINTIYLENPPTVQVQVNYFRDPVVAGYGLGLRSTLFGFFLRADYGWGIETREVQKPMLHVALGTDF